MNKHTQPIDPAIIAEAAEWLVEMQEGELSAEKQKQFEAWKSQGTEYVNAWQHAEQLQQYLNDVPSHVNDKLFDDKQFKLLSQKFIWILMLTGGLFTTGYYGKQNAWFADQRTAYGEQRTVILEDGSKIILNSKTAIDINFSKTARNIKLHYGEIYIQTAKDQSKQPRPFKVLSQDGSVLALGTQFNVEQLPNQTQVAVIEHAVLIENKSGIKQHLNAGEQTEFSTQHIGQPYAINTLDLAWHNHLIVADRMPLHEFIKQIEKHYGMSIEIDQRIKNLVISGTYPSNNLKVLTSTLAQAYQLEIETKTFPKKLIINKNDN